MEQTINAGGVSKIDTSSQSTSTLHALNVYIHHELTPERLQELATLIEGVVVRAATTWAHL